MKRKQLNTKNEKPPIWKLAPLLLLPALPLAGCQPQTPEEPTESPPPPPGAVEEEQIPPMQPPVSEPESQSEN